MNKLLPPKRDRLSPFEKWLEDIMKEMTPKRDRMKVTPQDIMIDYDILVRDGSVPGGNFSDVWVKLFQIIMGSPELASRFDTMRIFKHIARNVGAKNVDEFEIDQPVPPVQAQVQPDEQVEAGVQAGNLVPMG